MSGLGPPLRFKAVNTETGEERKCHHVKFFSDGGWKALTFDEINKEFEVIYCPPNTKCDWVLYQSTGLHDARGVEIFFGDVLMWDANLLGLYRVIWIDRGVFVYGLDDDPEDLMPLTPENQIEFDVIGNQWQSREVLEQKAEEVLENDPR